MAYQVTARKWRPLVFNDVIGQSHVSNTLKNAIAQNRLAHAFIFSGTRGCGKTTTARILARVVNCLNPKEGEPCNECEICREIIDGRSLDIIEIDGASNRGVDEIRNLRESVRYAPTRGKRKVYIIDEVHMLTKEAFNALLKTLEEPPAHILFIFATTEIHKVPATILSRCQRYDFRRIGIDEIVGRLKFIAEKENITIDADSLLLIAKKGDGSMRDAQSIFDQVISFCGTTITIDKIADALNIADRELFFRLSDVIKRKEISAGLTLVNEIVQSGYDIKEFISETAEHFRNLLIAKTTNSTQLIEESEVHRKRYADNAEEFSLQDILRIIKVVTETESSIRYSPQPRFKLEVMVVQLAKMDPSVKIDELLSGIDELSRGVSEKKKLNSATSVTQSSSYSHKTQSDSPVVSSPPRTFENAKPRYSYSTSSQSTIQESEPDSSNGTNARTVSHADVEREWNVIVDVMRKKKISVGTILGETRPVEISAGILRIACQDEFHMSTLTRNKEILTDCINSILSARLRIEPVIQSEKMKDRFAVTPNHDDSTSGNPAKKETMEHHPLIQTLFKDFDAERVS